MISLAALPSNYSKYFSRLLLILQSRGYAKIITVERKGVFSISRTAFSNVDSKEPRTAGVIVIGDEILKGQIRDTNSHFISKILYDLGVKVKRIIVIGDCKDEIVNEVKEASSKFTFVITTGGIGSTHDDVTYEGIAGAFNEPLAPHPELVKICSDFYKTSDLNAPAMKLAHIPKSARLTYGYDKVAKRRMLYPNVSVANVFIFPGVPQLLERSFAAVSNEHFGGGSCKFFVKEIYLAIEESKITNNLNTAVQEFPSITFGSYPEFSNSFYKVRITIESQVEHEVQVAYEKLKSTFPQEWVVQYDNAPLEQAYGKLMKYVNSSQGKKLYQSILLVEECCKKYKPEEMCVYFDGEKESTAILHLNYACLKKLKIDSSITALSVLQKSCKEIEIYIKEATCRYDLKIESLMCHGAVTPTVQQYLTRNPEIKVLLTGSTLNVSKVKSSFSLECPHIKLIQPFENWTSSEVSNLIVALYLPHYKHKL